MGTRRVRMAIVVLACLWAAGCATTHKDRPTGLRDAKSPAWSLHSNQREMTVSVSPVRQSLQILGSSVAILGAGIDSVVNAKYQESVRKALEGYDAQKVFEQRIEDRLAKALPQGAVHVAALTSTAGYVSQEQAERERYDSLASKGRDMVLDLRMMYGIFGYDGELVAKVDGRLLRLPDRPELNIQEYVR